MEIGIGLPATIPGVEGTALLEWARRADAGGFSTLGVVDRLAYPNYEPLIALTAAAAVTTRIRLTTSILLAPLRSNAALFAKQAASLDRLSGGRLVLGLAPGGREDDYRQSGLEFDLRGAELDDLLERVTTIWRDDPPPVGPAPAQPGGPPLVFGGTSHAAYRRMARYGAGWIAGGGGPELFEAGADRAREVWQARGRPGAPRLLALAYFALGPGARDAADRYLHHYYAFLGPIVDQIAAGALVDASQIEDQVEAFAAAGCDELILLPCDPDPAQVDLLAETVMVRGEV